MNKKNYLSALVAIFAMISVMILSSCSHDDFYYNEEKAEQAVLRAEFLAEIRAEVKASLESIEIVDEINS